MCGICGIIGGDRRQVEPATRAMMRAMIHRGPDDEGYEELPLGSDDAGTVAGFGFRRLAILDLSPAGHQPMFNERTGDCIVFNGEIYNFRHLRAELQANGVRFHSSSDTEVLLQALSVWGEQAIGKLQGMYAFAFYHAATRRILFARDPLGIKPLYVARLADRLVFASEVRAVLASGLVPRDLDLGGISGMLAYGAVQDPYTVYRHIRSFPAGHVQWVDETALAEGDVGTLRRVWDFPQRTISDDQPRAVQEVREKLRDAVLRHLVSDVPVGVFLSAGIDSTVIASFAREYTPRVTAFTVGFGSVHGEDEVALAAETAKALGVKHVAVELDASNMPEKWHDWLEGMDSPSIDGFNTYVVSERLAAEGVVVGLSGLGADELFGGYATFSRVPRWAPLVRALRYLPPSLRRAAASGYAWVSGSPALAEKLADLVAGDTSLAGITLAFRRSLSDSRIRAMGLAPDQVGLAGNYLPHAGSRIVPAFDGDAFNTVARIEATHYMRDTLLRDTDAVSMRHSLEVRVPFLDLPLVNYVSALPGSRKRDELPKALLRKAAGGVLSARITNRPKTGFTLPIGDWMRGAMREPCQVAIDNLAGQSFVDGGEVIRTWRTFLADSRSMHWSRPLSLIVLGYHLSQR